MPAQRHRLADIDHELERNFLNLSELKSNKRRRSENRSCSMGNMVKTMSVIHTHRKPSKPKDAASSRLKHSSRLTTHTTTRSRKAFSPGLDSSTAYDPSTSPTYYNASSSVETGSRAKKQRNCSPLPAWLANTFNSLVRNHPLRLLLPGNPSPPPSPSPILRRPLPPSPPSTVYHRSASRAPHIPRKSRHRSRNPPSTRQASQPREDHRPTEDRIFAFDPFEAPEVGAANALNAPGGAHEPATDCEQEAGFRADSYERDSPDCWVQRGEWPLKARQPRHDNRLEIHQEAIPEESPREYALPVFAAPSAPIALLPNSVPFEDKDQHRRDGSPPAWRHSLLSVPRHGSPIDELGLPGSQYVGQLYKTRGPASTIQVLAQCPKQIYFSNCPTEGPSSSPSYPTSIPGPVLCSKDSNPAISPHIPALSPFHPPPPRSLPLITPISKPSIPDVKLDFSWKKVDLNGIQAPSASHKKPIYQLPSSDDDVYTEISSVLPSLLLGGGTRTEGQVPARHGNPYDTPAPALNESKATYAPGPRLVRGSQSSNKSPSEKSLRIPTRGTQVPRTFGSPTLAFARPNTPVSRPNYAPPRQTALDYPTLPTDGVQAPPSTPVRQDGIPAYDVMKCGQADIEGGIEDRAHTLSQSMGGCVETKTPKSSAVFAPAPGIYISPLRGSDTSKEEKFFKDTAETGSSQVSNDSIQSWSDRF